MSLRQLNPVLVALLVSLPASAHTADETPQIPGPAPEHAFLKRFVGEWTTESQCQMGPDQPAMPCQGKFNARMLGDFWLISDTEGSMAGASVHAVLTLGYDPQQQKYVGTWVDSMMNHLWKYEGAVEGEKLILEASGPNLLAGGRPALFRDIYEFKSADEIAVSSQMQTEDGAWVTFITGTARRKP
ncbi:MAG: DUF1579 domain-containing protein [Planctomycetaceae bacterium]|nr:DUF1579 domain-containing protein [Planctomycetaceae bacterium]